MEKSSLNKKGGFGIIEVVVGITLASVFMTAFAALTVQTIKLNRANTNELKANIYLRELIEIAKDLEQSEDWNILTDYPCQESLGRVCYPKISSGKWILTTGAESLDNDIYNRSLTIADVYRNQLSFPNEIVASGGVSDPNTKKIIAKILWSDGSHPPMILETYVYNYIAP
ncbi:MAG: hypothetical protein Athens071424_13 [Parcubacteria group bacterium Athens0714_24]|nr:MAG: hypothetical protein Athens071424_13 [Parcubacteria group bacterium Athens0714_24]